MPLGTLAPRTPDDIAERGWRTVEVTRADGLVDFIHIPLTEDEFLHPQEGYHLPNSTIHDQIAGTVKDLLTRRYATDPTVGVFRDLIIKWDVDLGDHCPDTFVAFGLRDKSENRTEFTVTLEGTRPALVVEVVSPRYRKTDRELKVLQYAQARVQEYVIFDRRRQRGTLLEEVLGYRLVGDTYQPISPDDEGRIFCATVGVWMGLEDGQVVMVEGATGQRLLTSQELEQANQELTVANQELAAAKAEAEQRAAEMAALLAQYQQQFGQLPPQPEPPSPSNP